MIAHARGQIAPPARSALPALQEFCANSIHPFGELMQEKIHRVDYSIHFTNVLNHFPSINITLLSKLMH
jgi:hypothetical protein